MDDDRFAGKLLRQEPFRIEGQPGLSTGRLQNGHISGVRRMRTGDRIVMSFRIGKGLRRRPAAGRSFMDMEAEEAGSARFFRLRQAADIRQHHRPVLERVKGHKAPDVRIFFRTLHIRACRRLFREKFQHAVCEKSDHFFSFPKRPAYIHFRRAGENTAFPALRTILSIFMI